MNNYNQQEFSNYTVIDSQPVRGAGVISKKFMANVFSWMFVALGVSAFFAILFANNPTFTSLLYDQNLKGIRLNGMGMVVSFAPLIFVLLMSFAFSRLSAPLLTLFFLAFASTMGMSLSTLLFMYTQGSILGCFATASVMFGVMAVMGYTTDKDLTSFGSLMMMGLVGLVIATMVNLFLQSNMMGYIISIVGVAVFTGLTAYDVQRLKRIGAGVEYEGTSANDTKKLALMGALSLYLNFINLFIMLLRLFGNKRD
jgi:FtsH-binding integral membrane protein